jgi:hypothetical protein
VLRRHQAERHKRAQQYPRAQGRRRHRRERARQCRGALPRRAEHEWHDRNRKRHEQEWAARDDHRAHRILEEGRQRGCREARLVLRAFAPGHGRLAWAAAVPFARRHGAQLLRLGAIGAELRARCVGRGRRRTHDDATQRRRPSEKTRQYRPWRAEGEHEQNSSQVKSSLLDLTNLIPVRYNCM